MGLGMIAHAFNPNTWKQKQVDPREFAPSLFYTVGDSHRYSETPFYRNKTIKVRDNGVCLCACFCPSKVADTLNSTSGDCYKAILSLILSANLTQIPCK